MDIKFEKVDTNEVKLEITVPVENFRKAIEKAYKKNVGKISIPGFRKGKTPLLMIEKYYGDNIFFEDAIEILCDETYPKAIEEKNIIPVDYPKIEVIQVGKDVDFIYSAKVTTKPEVKLNNYKGIEVKKIEYTVTDEDVEAEINAIRERNARIINVEEGTVKDGDIAVINFEGFIDGVPFEGGKGEDYPLTIGSGSFIPGFEEQLVGAKVGETIDVNTSFPEDYHAENLKGKDVLFKVKVSSIRVKELAELDDEFVKEVSEFDTLDELRAETHKKQEETNKLRAKKDFEEEVVKEITNLAEIEIPEVMINKEIDYMVMDLDYRLKQQGLTVEKYTELMGVSIDKIREDFKSVAETRVKTNLVLETVAKEENIFATDEEIEAKADELANYYGAKDSKKIKESILKSQKEIIREELVNNKVVTFLTESAKAI